MTIAFHNTLTGSKDAFTPADGKRVTMYVCGVTPYDDVHLGHARAYVTFDVIRRHLSHAGYQVAYIQNFTDVDDKIIKRAAERGISPRALADRYIEDYFTQMDKLGIRRADAYPRVTEHIPGIISFIEELVRKGNAYAAGGDVYFSVASFPQYGKLSKRNLDDLKAGARVEVNDQKRAPLDFALWKAAKPNEPAEVTWDSPWGKGRPGWHIECSVMSTDILGATIDIHGGGMDLIFPHHENEVAQSEAYTGQPFVRHWIHNGFVTVNKEKMSKSLGNFFTLRDIFAKFDPRAVRYFLLSQHYRSPLDFSDDKLTAAAAALSGLDDLRQKLAAAVLPVDHPAKYADIDTDLFTGAVARFTAAMDDDFNTERALAVVHDLKREVLARLHDAPPQYLHRAQATLDALLGDRLGIAPLADAVPAEALALKAEREAARTAKDWKRSDELRARLDALGYKVEDKPGGTSILLKK